VSAWRRRKRKVYSSRSAAVLEKAQATLKLRDEEVTRLNGELAQLSVSYEDQRQEG
jgi:hypothetical protein